LRVRPVLEVSPAARKAIARLCPTGRRTVRGALATRNLIVSYLQDRLDRLSSLYPWWDDEPLTPAELSEARDAVEILKGAGKSDAEIRAWLFVQRARYDLREQLS